MKLQVANPLRDQRMRAAQQALGTVGTPRQVQTAMLRLQKQPELRAVPMEIVAVKTATPVTIIMRANAELIARARRQAGSPIGVNDAVAQMHPGMSFDDALSMIGSVAAPSSTNVGPGRYPDVSGPYHHGGHRRWRGGGGRRWGGDTIYVMAPSVLDDCLALLPPTIRSAPMIQRWLYLCRTGQINASSLQDAGVLPAGAVASDPDMQWYWIVKSGDNPSLYAKRITGDDRRYPEIMDANPEKATIGSRSSPYSTGFNFKSLVVGEKLKSPKAWNVYIATDGTASGGIILPTGPAPTTPTTSPTGTGTGMYSATLPTGAITGIKLQLGAWGAKEGTMTGYPGLYDTNDVIDEAFLGAVRKFQTWANGKGSSLRTDGLLDKATHDTINAYTAGTLKPGALPPPPGGTIAPPPGLPPLLSPPKTTTPGPIAVTSEKKKVGGSAAPILIIAGLGLAKAAHFI